MEGQRVCGDALPHEEFFITDFEFDDDGMAKAYRVDEYSDPYKLNEVTEELSNLEEFERLQVQFLLHEGYDFDYAIGWIQAMVLVIELNSRIFIAI